MAIRHLAAEIDLNYINDKTFPTEEKDNEQEIAFGAFSYYDDEDEEQDSAESRKRPQFPIFSEANSFGSVSSQRPTRPPAFVINSKDEESETETLPYKVIERGYVSEI